MNTIILFILFIPVLVIILLLLNLLLAVHRPDSEKVTPYECGFIPFYGQTRNPFSISFYLVGILFIIFDLEILFIYPYACIQNQLGIYGFWIIIMFFIVLTIGFIYEFGSGALYFTNKIKSKNSLFNFTIFYFFAFCYFTLFHYIIISLYYYFTILLFHYIIISDSLIILIIILLF